jgi:hypothetical protein
MPFCNSWNVAVVLALEYALKLVTNPETPELMETTKE